MLWQNLATLSLRHAHSPLLIRGNEENRAKIVCLKKMLWQNLATLSLRHALSPTLIRGNEENRVKIV